MTSTVVCGERVGIGICGRPIVQGFYLRWVHAEPRRGDPHYAHPAPRTAPESDLARVPGGIADRRDEEPTPPGARAWAPDQAEARRQSSPAIAEHLIT